MDKVKSRREILRVLVAIVFALTAGQLLWRLVAAFMRICEAAGIPL